MKNSTLNTPTWFKGFMLGIGLCVVYIFATLHSIPDFFSGEEFYVLHYANNLSFFEAWLNYFTQNGRLLEGFYWTALYQLLGYQPAFSHAISIFLHLLGSAIFSLVIIRALALTTNNMVTTAAFLLPLALFFNLASFSFVFKLSIDNSRLALLFTGVSFWFLQEWARSRLKSKWLLISLAVFCIALFFYEQPAFVFPAGMLFAFPFFPQEHFKKNVGLRLFLIALGSMFVVLVPFSIYSLFQTLTQNVMQHPAENLAGNPLRILIEAITSAVNYIPEIQTLFWTEQPSVKITISVISSILILLAISIPLYEAKRVGIMKTSPISWILLGSVWFSFWGSFPYALIGYGPTPRAYIGISFGLAVILVTFFLYMKHFFTRSVFLLLIFAWIGSATIILEKNSQFSNAKELALNEYYLRISDLVPSINEYSVFVLLDHKLSDSGCGPSFAMLFDRPRIHCAFISSTDPTFTAIRKTDYFNAPGGPFDYHEYIIIGLDDHGLPVIVPELSPLDPYLIIWESEDPIRTTEYPFLPSTPNSHSLMEAQLEYRNSILTASTDP